MLTPLWDAKINASITDVTRSQLARRYIALIINKLQPVWATLKNGSCRGLT